MASKSQKKSTGSNAGIKLAVLAGAAVAAAAGAYYVTHNKNAKKQVKKIKGWALKVKGDVLSKLEQMKNVDEALYNSVVDGVMKKYQSVKNIDTSELSAVSKELKSHWNNIKKELSTATKATKKTASSMVKKAKKAVTK